MARYFLWTYETALIEECGYKGAQPYWDWVSSFYSTPTIVAQMLTNVNITDHLHLQKQPQMGRLAALRPDIRLRR